MNSIGIKADTTFEGLRHALREPSERIFVGDLPPKLSVVAQNKTKYIHEVRITKTAGSPLQEVWFDQTTVPFNYDLVAIIGNKGTGKSALADILGLLGNSKRDRYFSFLNDEKFRDPKANKSKYFEATVEFVAGSPARGRLDGTSDPSAVPMLRYLPQNYIERLCNEIAAGPSTDFDRELKTIIFSHVPEESRLGLDSLDAVVAYRTSETQDAISLLKRELGTVNAQILTLEEQSGAPYRIALEKALSAKGAELAAHDGSAPAEVKKPELDEATQKALAAVRDELTKHRSRQAELTAERTRRVTEQGEAAQKLAATDKLLAGLTNLSEQFARFGTTYAHELQTIGLSTPEVATLDVKRPVLDQRKTAYTAQVTAAKERIAAIDVERASLAEAIGKLSAQLDEPTRAYEAYLSAREAWEARRLEIVGNPTTPGTLEYLKARLDEIPALPQKLEEAGERRRAVVKQIFQRLSTLADVYRDMYAAVQSFIETHEIARDKFQLKFHVSVVNKNFKERFVDFINRGVTGSFCGIEESDRLITTLLAGRDFSLESDVVAFADTIADYLRFDKRGHTQTHEPIDIQSQLRKGHSAGELYNFVYSLDYLEPRYSLRMGTKEVTQLSPGEKGALLLVFYLLVDKGDIPLIIDQPEGNLDNETIVDLLVPCIREAKKRRQIIIVTHNPNLAVVCDADQVIWASLDKTHDYRVTYECGALENPVINKKVVDILEGTQPAFDNRDSKYLRPQA